MKIVVLAALAVASSAGAAAASIQVATDAARPSLRVDARGNAEVSWLANGTRRTLLVPVSGRVLPGGRLSGADVSQRARRDLVPMARVVRRGPGGYLWALQEWARAPGEPEVLHLARWKGAPTKLTLAVSEDAISGRVTFAGRPVFGSTTTPAGRPMRINVYLDCTGCPGARHGWKRMLGIAPRRDGTFRTSLRPQWLGSRYRATVAGPNRGATRAPDARVIVSG
jgi:hypothetical protein